MTDTTTNDQLRSIVDRIERLEEEKAETVHAIGEVYHEAKGAGFDTKALRQRSCWISTSGLWACEMAETNAADELLAALDDDENVEAIIFGNFGNRSFYDEGFPRGVPESMQDRVLTFIQAMPLMRTWTTKNGYGSPDTVPMFVWTDRHVYFIHEYAGATGLTRIPRNPTRCAPGFSGEYQLTTAKP